MNTYAERLRQKMGCKYDHAAIYIGDAYLMEANGAHVVMTHIYSYAFREADHACVLRLKKLTLQNIARASRQQMGVNTALDLSFVCAISRILTRRTTATDLSALVWLHSPIWRKM